MTWKKTYDQWLAFNNIDNLVKEDLERNKNNEEALMDAFYAPLEFGTAGMRGVIGAGINRMNIYTIRQATEGLARFIDSLDDSMKQRGVAIAFDSRHQSPEFALGAAETLAAHGITSYVFESLRSTPELSFTVRHFNCVAGIMITASHNPKEYNGFKVYGDDGAQMPPHDADLVTKFVRSIDNPLEIKVTPQYEAEDLIHIVGEEVDTVYLEHLKTVTVNQEVIDRTKDSLKIVYTPLHGTGQMVAERAMEQAGFKHFITVPEQKLPDADFSTVISPNPEEASAFEYAIALGEKENADVLLATDPDADRLGAVAKNQAGDYQILSGNQLGSIMIHYLLQEKAKQGTLAANSTVVKSIVSSELSAEICKKYQVEMRNVLTGFKFIAEQIKNFEEDNSRTFVFGFEESYGYLVKPFVRDKDAIQALLLLSEITAFYKEKNQTLFDALEEIYAEFGFFDEKTISVTMPGITGVEKIQQLMKDVRESIPTAFADVAVAYHEDYASQKRHFVSGEVEDISLPPSNVLKFFLEDGSWIAIRPSGTEPKVKFYLGVKGNSHEETQEKINKFEEAVQGFIKE
ncbi:phospho-sugar mutase [Vagococcus sp. DIV0080]|uniref:Phosphoglucomutase n=1 Tax=Candidatus Vagococcus giribetii TaxID=2230876 RepID=A0ABS3HSG2_9ENTE|nr:phospho-sugar mutase [Vagococcus sp. DIV0080]